MDRRKKARESVWRDTQRDVGDREGGRKRETEYMERQGDGVTERRLESVSVWKDTHREGETEKEDERLRECVERQREGGRKRERVCGETHRERGKIEMEDDCLRECVERQR